MPLILHEEVAEDTRFGVWEISESEEKLIAFLTPAGTEPQELKDKSHPVLRKQWLAARLVIGHLLGHRAFILQSDVNGKPLLTDPPCHVSITHSGNYAACILSGKFKVGIDIEQVRPRIAKLGHVFLSDEEILNLGNEDLLKKLTLSWSAKEALFKMVNIPGLEFKRDIKVYTSMDGNRFDFPAMIHTPTFTGGFTVHCRLIGDYALAWTYS